MHRNSNPRWWLYTDLRMRISEDEGHNLGIQHSIILDDTECQQWMMLWGTWVTRKNIYKTVMINILLLWSEVRYFNKYMSKNILAVEMDCWRQLTRMRRKAKTSWYVIRGCLQYCCGCCRTNWVPRITQQMAETNTWVIIARKEDESRAYAVSW